MRRIRSPMDLALALSLALVGCFQPSGKEVSTGDAGTTEAATTTEAMNPTSTEAVSSSTTEVMTSMTSEPTTATSDEPETTLPSDDMCGNGEVDPDEACDDGNFNPGDGCEPDCTKPPCGDGIIGPDEECDDAGVVDGDGCSAACRLEEHYVFATSSRFTGALGGVTGADAVCNGLASAHFSEERRFVAWLSGPKSVKERLVGGPYRYVTPEGGVVAGSFEDLISGSLSAPIDSDEAGNILSVAAANCDDIQGVWTGTDATGSATLLDCGGWTTIEGTADAGVLTETTAEWSVYCQPGCDMMLRLYCVETLGP